jgi:hypothetical protein
MLSTVIVSVQENVPEFLSHPVQLFLLDEVFPFILVIIQFSSFWILTIALQSTAICMSFPIVAATIWKL